MESSSTASLQQMHTITNLASTSSLNSTSPSFEDDAMVQCPTCDMKLHRYEVAKHCEQEMQRLKDLQTQTQHALTSEARFLDVDEEEELAEGTASNGNEAGRSNGQSNAAAVEKRKPWSVFQRVQRNRQSRMKVSCTN